MTPDASQPMNNETNTRPKLSLAELLQRSLDEDAVFVPRPEDERERYDEDEGTFGG